MNQLMKWLFCTKSMLIIRSHNGDQLHKQRNYQPAKHQTFLDYSKPVIIGGQQNFQPTEVVVHQVVHQTLNAPPKVYYGKSQPSCTNDSKIAANPNPKHQNRVASTDKSISAMPKQHQAHVAEPAFKTIAKNRQGTLQVNANVDLKALFSD
jgi:hypothetical protein